MILGAARCGTSSLHEFFRQHPGVCASVPKEPYFFEDEYDKGLDHYRRTYFPHWNGQRVVVEGRPANMVLPYVAPRIKESFPDARFIISLRDPAERAFSHWALRYSVGLENRRFDVAIAENCRQLQAGNVLEGPNAERIWRAAICRETRFVAFDVYLDAGFYAAHLRRFFALFPRERFCILTVDELRRDPAQVAQRLFHFAGLDPTRGPASIPHANASLATGPRLLHRIDIVLHLRQLFSPELRLRLRAWTSRLQRRLKPPAETMRWLREYYAPHDRDLCELLGWAQCPWRSERA